MGITAACLWLRQHREDVKRSLERKQGVGLRPRSAKHIGFVHLSASPLPDAQEHHTLPSAFGIRQEQCGYGRFSLGLLSPRCRELHLPKDPGWETAPSRQHENLLLLPARRTSRRFPFASCSNLRLRSMGILGWWKFGRNLGVAQVSTL